MLPAVSPYASLFLQSAAFICISTLTAFKQSQRFSLLLFLAVCNVSSRVHPGRLVLSNGMKLQNCHCPVCAEMRTKRAWLVFFAHLGFVFFTCAKNLVLIMSETSINNFSGHACKDPTVKELLEKDNVCLWKMRRTRLQHYYPCKIGFKIYRFASQGPFKDKTDMADRYSDSLNAERYSLALSEETGNSSSCCLIEMQRWCLALVLEV